MSIDVYFTDRKFNVLGIATAGGHGSVSIINDVDDQLAPNSVGRSYTGTLITDPTNSAKLADMAALGNFVLYQDPRGKYVFATVMDWPEPGYDPQSGELDFVAENGGIDLINETVGAYKATKAMPIADYIKLFTSDSGFEIGTNEIATLSRTLEWDSTDETALARIESVATQFDNAELDFRFEIDGTAVVKRYIDIYKHIGSDKGQRLEVNTQVNSIKTTGNIYDLCTSIKATGGTPDGKDVPITLKGYNWTDPDGRYVLGADGTLRDTVAVQLWSRTLSNDNQTPTNHHIQRVKTYDATTQATLVQSALADLKQANHASINYVVDVADLPDQVQIGDTVHLVDEAQGLNLSARLLELKDSYANDTHEATLGDYLIEANQIDPALQDVANQLKTLKQTAHWYPWTRYADNDQGAGISSLPLGKAYMAVVWGKTATPSDDPADYAGHWQKVTGTDGTNGTPGPKGADGKTPYFHTAYANDIAGTGLSQDPTNKSYIGIYSDYTQADSTTPSSYKWALFKGTDGADGVAGKDGVGVKSTAITYALGDSGTSKPTNGWNTSVPSLVKGKYLWTKTVWLYTDNTSESGYSATYIGKDGNDGNNGIAGKDGVGISATKVEYAGSTSGTTKPTSGWTSTVPNVAAGSFLWTKTTWNYTDGTSESGYSVAKMGEKGDQGIKGPAGADGKSSYTHIAYANIEFLCKENNDFTLSGTSLVRYGYDSRWVYKEFKAGTYTATTTLWGQGDPAVGSVKNAELVSEFSTSNYASTTYIGMYVDFTATDSNDPSKYAWSLIKGADGVAGKDGVGIKSTQIMYAQSTSGTTAPTTGWNAQVPTLIKGHYLWTQTTWVYTDNTGEAGYTVSYNAKDGNNGANGIAGKDGTGIKTTTITYASSTSGTTAPTSGWTANPPATNAGQFLWTRTTWLYTDGTNEVGYSVAQAGEQGERGKQIFKSSYEGNPSQSGRFWSDLSPAPSVDNPPKIGDTVITPAGNIFQINTVTVGGGGGGGTFGVGDVLGNIQGPQGPQGVPGSQDVPMTYVQTAQPTGNIVKDSLWWVGATMSSVTALKRWNGSSWIPETISQDVLNVVSLNAVDITGSTFASANSRVIANGEEELYTVGTTLTNTQTLDKMGYTSVAQGSIMGDTTPNSFKATTTIGNTGSIRSRADFASGDWSIITIDPTQSAMTMSNSQNTSGALNADYLSRVNNCGKMLWSGTAFLNEKQTLTPSVAINKCLNGWMLEWQEYKNGSASGTDVLATPIYSRMVARLSGAGFNLPMATYAGGSFNKYCYPTNTTLTGNAKNGTAGSSAASYVLTAIFSF